MDNFINNIQNNNNDNVNSNLNVNVNTNLYNPNNPFKIASNNTNINKNDLTESNISMKKEDSTDTYKTNNNNENHKRGKYQKREPLYFYYTINDKVYRYTCENKNNKTKFKFNCSDSKCPATAEYSKLEDKFIPNEDKDKQHIAYEDH